MRKLTESEQLARRIKQMQIRERVAGNNVNRANKKWVRSEKSEDWEFYQKMAERHQQIFWNLNDLVMQQKHGGKKWH